VTAVTCGGDAELETPYFLGQIDRDLMRKLESLLLLWGIAVPLYEYQCKSCHSLTERIQKFSDPPLTTCPHCGGELERLLSAPAVQFKGSGWYVTDYARKSSPSASGGNGAAASKPAEGSGAGSSSAEKGSSGTDPASKK